MMQRKDGINCEVHMNVRVIHGQPKEPTPEEVETYIFRKWDKALAELAKGPSEPYPAYHEIASDVDVKATGPR
jgi:hypothetical protein